LSVLGRAAVVVVLAAVVGEIAAVVMFSGSIDQRIDQQAAQAAVSTPAIVQAAADAERIRQTRIALDVAVEDARTRRDQALVVARCEFNPSPSCPETRITGVPGAGPETRTANDVLADTQRELDDAITARDRLGPGLDSQVEAADHTLAQARQSAISSSDRGPGARWVAMHGHTLSDATAMALWLLTIAFFAVLSLLPLLLKLFRDPTTTEHTETADAAREHAELDADTSISVKRAQVRATIENLWADQQLASARLAVEAQNEIDRELHRRRIQEALEARPVHASSHRVADTEPQEEDDLYLPIAAQAEAASLAAAETKNLPARRESDNDDPDQTSSLIPAVTKTAARWIRPFVPPIVARAIDSTSHPIRTARQAFEEVEEITFSLKRTHRVTVSTEESIEPTDQHTPVRSEPWQETHEVRSFRSVHDQSSGLGASRRPFELDPSEQPGRLRSADRRELPPSQ
jgi:hypothetical protein